MIVPVDTHRVLFEKVIFEVAVAMSKKSYRISSSSKTLYFSEFELEIPSSPIEQDDFIAWILYKLCTECRKFYSTIIKNKYF